MARDERAGSYDERSRSKEHLDAAHSSGVRVALPRTAPGATPSLAAEVVDLHAKLERLNHFELLKIPETADRQSIRSAFAQSARRFHPNRLGGDDQRLRPLAAKVFLRMAEAYQVLYDESARKQYIASLGFQTHGSSLRPGTEPAPSARRLVERTTRRPGT